MILQDENLNFITCIFPTTVHFHHFKLEQMIFLKTPDDPKSTN